MNWRIRWMPRALKDARKLSPQNRKRIFARSNGWPRQAWVTSPVFDLLRGDWGSEARGSGSKRGASPDRERAAMSTDRSVVISTSTGAPTGGCAGGKTPKLLKTNAGRSGWYLYRPDAMESGGDLVRSAEGDSTICRWMKCVRGRVLRSLRHSPGD